jgi:hypothetical protein
VAGLKYFRYLLIALLGAVALDCAAAPQKHLVTGTDLLKRGRELVVVDISYDQDRSDINIQDVSGPSSVGPATYNSARLEQTMSYYYGLDDRVNIGGTLHYVYEDTQSITASDGFDELEYRHHFYGMGDPEFYLNAHMYESKENQIGLKARYRLPVARRAEAVPEVYTNGVEASTGIAGRVGYHYPRLSFDLTNSVKFPAFSFDSVLRLVLNSPVDSSYKKGDIMGMSILVVKPLNDQWMARLNYLRDHVGNSDYDNFSVLNYNTQTVALELDYLPSYRFTLRGTLSYYEPDGGDLIYNTGDVIKREKRKSLGFKFTVFYYLGSQQEKK